MQDICCVINKKAGIPVYNYGSGSRQSVYLCATLRVEGLVYLCATLRVKGLVYLCATLRVKGLVYLCATLRVKGLVYLCATLRVKGLAYLCATLRVRLTLRVRVYLYATLGIWLKSGCTFM